MTAPHDPPAAATVSDSGTANADRAGVANSGIIQGDVRPEFHEHHHYAPAAAVTWPVQVGQPPPMASAFQPRDSVRARIQDARDHGADVVLTQRDARPAGTGTRVLAGEGGVGKSQLAAWFAHQAVIERDTDLVAWVLAGSPEQIITGYARAALRVGVPGADGTDPAADAAAFREWLHTTDRTWLIILDDITDPAHLRDWWPPHRPTGWTLATTRRRDAALASGGRRSIDIGVYSPDESLAYLTTRLTEAERPGLLDAGAADLAAALGHLPLALSHATAYMIDQAIGCTAYLARYTAAAPLAEVMPADSDPDDYGRPVAVTLLLALDAADQANPVGLARPALALAAMLSPDGHPDDLWKTAAVTAYLSEQVDRAVTADQSALALRTLHRYGLLTHAPADGARAVRVHALTARATQEASTIDPATVVRAAADALLQLWPELDYSTTTLVDVLRTNTTTLAGLGGDLLWHSDGHPLLHWAGTSLLRSGLHALAIGYWHRIVDDAVRLLGDDHPNTITAHAELAASYWQAGRTTDAITIEERVVTDRVRLLGNDHPDTLTAHANLAASYRQAGRTTDAITIEEKVVTDSVRLLGHDHPNTITAHANLATSYWQAGRTTDAITILEQVVTDRVRLLGHDHPDTITAHASLATSYWQAGRTTDAITILEKVVTDRVRLLGHDHPNTLTAHANLAASYRQAGRTTDAITILEKVVTDRVRLLGHDHPNTLTAHANLAASYRQAGRTTDAITILEKVVTDRVRLLGHDHPNTLTAHANLAASYRQAGRTTDAITIQEKVVTDSVRLLGHDHPNTLTAHANLAASYRQAGRTTDAITIQEKVVTDRVRILGDEHPHTVAAVQALRAWRAGA
ncbi:tetratricopeptide repeat protein [Solwaraspora sp. WMMD406]|uniref:tetratricopeptide repeat protein n=1 Tax=Solwaraspora sp. WMMD406 TaxID=3016095 RepID=UPI002418138F|nr:tetratricopeptide repeat protein [Solwaraspora sp. WMMD406]MDG4765770.1 tetratricopeptide repeat protein [Solwaraspora sp. WMMD406]